MPIYAYKCETCGFAKDVLQKISDAPLTDCPSCQAATFRKQVTAAGFQLKGSGWYVTDFRGGGNAAPATSDGKSSDSGAGKSDSGSSGGGGDAKPAGASGTQSESTAASKPASEPAAKKTTPSTSSGSGSGS